SYAAVEGTARMCGAGAARAAAVERTAGMCSAGAAGAAAARRGTAAAPPAAMATTAALCRGWACGEEQGCHGQAQRFDEVDSSPGHAQTPCLSDSVGKKPTVERTRVPAGWAGSIDNPKIEGLSLIPF